MSYNNVTLNDFKTQKNNTKCLKNQTCQGCDKWYINGYNDYYCYFDDLIHYSN